MTREAGWISTDDNRHEFWRLAASYLERDIPPDKVVLKVAGEPPDLFASDAALTASRPGNLGLMRHVDDELRAVIDRVLLHRDPERFHLCYRLLWRQRAERRLLEIASDADVARVRRMEKDVRRDIHKMTAFVRFRAIPQSNGDPIFVAWFEPSHHIVAATAPFFRDRFAEMAWSILTPDRSVHWNLETLTFARGARREEAPAGDPLEALWKTYYAHIFNPARLAPKAMRAHMPKKYWQNLPEAELISPLIASARKRTSDMIGARATTPERRIVPYKISPVASSADLAAVIAGCTRCPLHCHATQAVMGEGPMTARLMIVGEQPGHEEDLIGRPFVGPAGRLLDIALQRSGIDRQQTYVTNAVKHFKFEPRGKQRLHKSPDASEIEHCRWWLQQEIALVNPAVTLALGVTAARGILGRPVKLRDVRSEPIAIPGGHLLATVHPAFLLRLQDESSKREEWHRFLGDLVIARQLLEASQPQQRAAGAEAPGIKPFSDPVAAAPFREKAPKQPPGSQFQNERDLEARPMRNSRTG